MSQDASPTPSPIDQNAANPLLEGLNKAQREAVTHMDGPMLVLAGPGSGKTRVVTHRIAWLLQNGIRDSHILALTFTNKAADEMKRRLQTLAPGNRVWIGTFHRFCAFLLRYYARFVGLEENYAIYDAEQSKKLLEEVAPKTNLPNGIDVQKIASGISWAKNDLVDASEYTAKDGSLLGKVVEDVYPRYQEALKKANAVDFDDLLFHVAVLLKQNPEIRSSLDANFRYILVDEYQDTNLVQYAIARALSIDYPNLAATGDPDQSIYGWRGANINNILNFEEDFPDAKVVRLEQNYRSVKGVLRVADSLIKHNTFRKDKDLYTDNKEGVPPRIIVNYDQEEEAETIAAEIAAELAAGKRKPQDYAIFYRMNALSRNLEYALKRYGVPYQLVRGLEFFNRKEVKDLCSYLQLVHNPSDVVAFKRVVNLPARGVGRVSLARLEQFAEDNGTTLFDAARSAARIGGLSTKVQKALLKFVALVDRLAASFSEGADMEVVLGMLLEETKYVEYLRNSTKTEEDEQRLANIQELLSEVREFDSDFAQLEQENAPVQLFNQDVVPRDRLGTFLEQIALISDVDAWNSSDDRVSLMTLHAAKGLEFPVVYIVAIEDGVLPHERSKNDIRQLEEERRLLFVGLTRAKEELRLSRTRFREFRGSYSPSLSSRFLFEFPKTGIDSYNSLQELLNTLEAEASNDPNAGIVVPRLFERKEGISQRRALWENGLPNLSHEDAFPFDRRLCRDAGRRGQRGNQGEASDFSDFDNVDEYVRPDSENDYLQALPESAERVDKPTQDDSSELDLVFEASPDSEPTFYGDFDGDAIVIDINDESESQNRPYVKRPSVPKRTPRQIKPGALSTASSLENGTNKEKHDNSVGTPPREIVVHSFVQHKKYGVGVVNAIFGPSFDRIARISFLSGIGELDLPLSDPELVLVAIGRGNKKG